jgi:hypothetical protein
MCLQSDRNHSSDGTVSRAKNSNINTRNVRYRGDGISKVLLITLNCGFVIFLRLFTECRDNDLKQSKSIFFRIIFLSIAATHVVWVKQCRLVTRDIFHGRLISYAVPYTVVWKKEYCIKLWLSTSLTTFIQHTRV